MKKIYFVLFLLFTLTSQAQITISPLGLGVTPTTKIGRGAVNRLFTDTIDNVLYAVGGFSSMGGINCYGVAKWDGQNWDSLGSGIRESFVWDQIQNVKDVIRFQNEIYICGAFYKCGGKNITSIAKWNGTEWFEVGGGLTDTSDFGFSQWATVKDMEVFNNELYIIGSFRTAGNINTKGIAKWDGQTWTDLSQGIINPNSLLSYQSLMFYNNELYLGAVAPIGLQKRVGNTWIKVGPGVKGDAWINRLEVYQNNLYVAGYFQTPAGNIDNSLLYTNGTSYFGTAGGVLPSNLFDLQEHRGELYACGQFDYAGFQPVGRIAKWNGTQWFNTNLNILDPPNNPAGTLRALEIYNGELIVAGQMSQINNTQVWGIASIDFGTVGVSNISQGEGIKLYPNPANDVITVNLGSNFPSDKTLLVYDMYGKLVIEQDISNQSNLVNIDLSNYNKGLYFIKVVSELSQFTEKIILN